MAIYVKPSGVEVEVNDSSASAAKDLGWKLKGAAKPIKQIVKKFSKKKQDNIMATAAQVLKSALQRILVQASESELDANEYSDAMFSMNNLMAQYASEGISLGYTEVNNLSDTITIPDGALVGLIANLAVHISPDYNGNVTQALAMAADTGLKTMRKIAVVIPDAAYPSTLPIGSGNTSCAGDYQSNYYPDKQDEILTETDIE